MAHDTSAVPRDRELAVRLLVLAGPVIATNISRTVMSFIDFVMVSRLGTEAQAAVTPAGLLLWCAIGLGMGTVSAVNTFASQSLGRNRPADSTSYAWQGLYLSVIVGAVFAPAWFAVEPFFAWVDHGPGVVDLEVAYASIGILGIAPAIAATALSNFFTGIHRPGIGFAAALISNVFNVAANYALIFGHWGFGALGIAGAAWGTVAASVLHMAILLGWLLLPYYARRFGSRTTWRFHRRNLGGLVRVGLPTGMQLLVDLTAWFIFTTFLVGRFGPVHLAASNVCFKLLEMSFMPAVGFGMALTAAVGRSIGENRRDIARAYVRVCLRFSVGYMGLTGLMMALFRYELPALLTADSEVIAASGWIMLMCAAFQVFDALGITYGCALRGAGDTVWPAIVHGVCAVVILLGGGAFLAAILPHWASHGPWLAALVFILVLGIWMWSRFRHGPWERLELVGGGDGVTG